jgi:hypothetical protein
MNWSLWLSLAVVVSVVFSLTAWKPRSVPTVHSLG